MTDISCLLAGLAQLSTPVILLVLWRKTNARILPAFAAFAVCIPVFMIAGFIRMGFSHDNPWIYYWQQGLLYGIFEESTKFLMFRFLLESYDNRKDAVTYGIGHASYESLGAGLSCLGLIGAENVHPAIFWINLWGAIEGAAFAIGATVLIFYGIQMGKSKKILPVVILLHTILNASKGIFIESFAIVFCALLTVAVCYVAYRCYQNLWDELEIE